jgi:hypothetical protein
MQLLVVVGISLATLFCYCEQMQSKTGVFTTSSVQPNNEYVIACNIGLLTSKNVTDPTIRQRVLEFEKKGVRDNVWDVPNFWDLPLKQQVDEIQRIKSHNIVEWYVKTFLDNLRRSCTDDISGCNHVDFPIVYLLLLITGVYLVYDWFRTHTCQIVTLFLWLMCVGNIMVNLLGSYAEWTRLFVPSIPMFIMLLAVMSNLFKIEYSANRQLP